MQSSICKKHNQYSHECFPLHNTKPLRKTPSLPQQFIVNRALALNRHEIDSSWSWYYKLAFGFYNKLGRYKAAYSRRLNRDPPPRDLSATNLVINFPSQAHEDD